MEIKVQVQSDAILVNVVVLSFLRNELLVLLCSLLNSNALIIRQWYSEPSGRWSVSTFFSFGQQYCKKIWRYWHWVVYMPPEFLFSDEAVCLLSAIFYFSHHNSGSNCSGFFPTSSGLFLDFTKFEFLHILAFFGPYMYAHILQKLIKLMNGRLSVRSKPGEGSLFEFTSCILSDMSGSSKHNL
jgi:hypothetical protein